jgi:hypothetical protein
VEFHAQARPSTVLHAPMSDLRWRTKNSVPCKSPGQVGQAGLHWTVEVALERETPSHPAAAGGKLPLPRAIENAAATVIGPASEFRGGNALSYTSQRLLIGTETVTDRNIFPPGSKLSAVRWAG